MAGTVTSTVIHKVGTIKLVKFEWTSSAGGAADGATTEILDGDIIGLATVPDGTAAPTDDYDVVVTDNNGIDVLLGAGADRDTANTEYVQGSSLGAVASSILTLAVTNAGNAKAGVVYIYLR